MDDERRRAQQASRTAFLRAEADRRKRASAAVLKEKIGEMEQGVVPASLMEADFLLRRAEELSTAEGLHRAARHRQAMEAGEGTLSDMEEWVGGRGLATNDPSATALEGLVGKSALSLASALQLSSSSSSLHASPHHHSDRTTASTVVADGFVAMDEDTIQKRIAAKDYVAEKTHEELEMERLAALQSQHARLQAQRRSLPISKVRAELLETIRAHRVVVLVGETGSGKTTQILQYLYEEGLHLRQRSAVSPPTVSTTTADGGEGITASANASPEIGEDGMGELRLLCTQPRRIAAISVAERVAQEMGRRCGSTVGYKVRFDDCSGPLTRILYMTDGMMLKEFTTDPDLSSVAAIMVDEAHERSLSTDILLGLLRDVIRRNANLKVIVASATINAEKFSNFFSGAPVFTVSGRTYPVDIFYTDEPVADYVTESAQTVMGLHVTKPMPGDILVFLPGQDAIETCAGILRCYVAEGGDSLHPLLIVPVYSALSPKDQARIYERTPLGMRKVVIATNIAETSITIDGIVYVVDCGLCKQDFYNTRAMVDELRVVPTSQASAAQRAGRAGRTQRGECYRLFTSYTYRNELPAETVPEIMRCSMSAVVLQLKALGIHNLLEFDFLDAPSTAALERALDHLYLLGAMKSDGRLTVTGRRMAEFPLDPSLSKCLVKACALGCGRHMAMAAAMLTLDAVFMNTRDPKEMAQIESAKDTLFAFGNGDVAGYVRVLDEWLRAGPRAADLCKTYCLNARNLLRARDVLDQILKTLDRIGLDLKDNDVNGKATSADDSAAVQSSPFPRARIIDVELLTKALLSGFFFNVARLEADKRTYITVRPMDGASIGVGPGAMASAADVARCAELHPTSYLFRAGRSARPPNAAATPAAMGEGGSAPALKERPGLVVFTQLRQTTKRYMIHVSAIPSPELVLEMAPENYFQREELEVGLRKRPRR